MKIRARLLAAVLLATPAAALAAPGMINTPVNLRAGPSVEFPVVDRLPQGVPVEVHGCIRDALWCDVSWERERGWVAAQYLDYLYGDRYVYLPNYLGVVDVPAASFVLTSYWSSYYIGRPWYRRHAWWNRHWTTQARVAFQATAGRPAQMGNAMTPTAASSTAVSPKAMSPNAMPPAGTVAPPVGAGKPLAGIAKPPAIARPPAGVANAAPTQAMAVPIARGATAAGGQDRISGMRPPMRSGAAGQANAIRASGHVPMAARAQLGGSRGGLGGGAPQGGGAMRNGGGGRDGGGGRHRH
jgi:uncharacterized protein YraI